MSTRGSEIERSQIERMREGEIATEREKRTQEKEIERRRKRV